MRKLVMIVLVTVVVASGEAIAAPVSFSLGAQHTATQPVKPAAKPTRFLGRFLLAKQKPANKAGNFQVKKHPKAAYAKTKPSSQANSIDAALSLGKGPEKPSPELMISFANAAEAQQQIDSAREHLKRAVGLAPTDAKTLRAAGHFEDRQGELTTAEALYRRAAQSNPSSAASVNDLAICLARQGRLQESAAAFEQAIALRPQKALYRNNIAKVLVELDNEQKALEHLVAAHQPAAAHYNLGYLLSASGNPEAAAKNYQLALAADPTFTAAQQALASLNPAVPAVANSNPSPAVPTQAAAAPAVAGPALTESLPPAPGSAPVYYATAPYTPPYATAASPSAPTPNGAPAVAAPMFPRLLPPIVRQR